MKVTISFLFLTAWIGCASLTLQPVDFSWPIESVLSVGAHGMVDEVRYNISFNVKPLFYAETGDSSNVANKNVRVIRDRFGYYYLTSSKFKNVYVFEGKEGKLSLEAKIQVSEKGLTAPAFNQRTPYIQLLNENDKPILLSRNGIQQGGQK